MHNIYTNREFGDTRMYLVDKEEMCVTFNDRLFWGVVNDGRHDIMQVIIRDV